MAKVDKILEGLSETDYTNKFSPTSIRAGDKFLCNNETLEILSIYYLSITKSFWVDIKFENENKKLKFEELKSLLEKNNYKIL